MRIVAGWHATAAELETVRRALGTGVDVVGLPRNDRIMFPYGAEREAYVAAMADADAVITWTLPPEVVGAAPRLKYVSWLHSGCDRLPFDEFKTRGIQLTNVPEAHQPAIAEHAWSLILACLKKTVWKHEQHIAGRYVSYWQDAGVGSVLHGCTMVLLGVGGIGRRIAAVAKAFDMRVIAVRKNPDLPAENTDAVYGQERLHDALALGDVVVVATPSTSRTRNMIDHRAIAAIKPHAYLVNIARGDIVNEWAIHDALVNERIAGFASDVWWDYEDAMPPDQHFGSPSRLGVHLLPNVVVSGDQASNVFFARDAMLDLGLRNLAAMLAGERPPHLVDLDAQY
jgi:phosphoglycerate dehydrogenase-like enzyme